MSPAEVERQREKIMRAPLVVRDREYPFSEDVIVDETGEVDPNLGVMAKVSSLIEVQRLDGSYELVYRLWAQFTLSAVRVNVDVTWSRDAVLVSSYTFSSTSVVVVVSSASDLITVSVHYPEWDVSAVSVALCQLGQITRELWRWVRGGMRQGAGVSSHLWRRHVQESFCGHRGSLQQRSTSRNFGFVSGSGCLGAWRVGGVT